MTWPDGRSVLFTKKRGRLVFTLDFSLLKRWGLVEWLILSYLLTLGLFTHVQGLALMVSFYGSIKVVPFFKELSSSDKRLVISFLLFVFVAVFSSIFVAESEHPIYKLEKYFLFLWAIPFFAAIVDRKMLLSVIKYAPPAAAVLMFIAALISKYYLGQSRVMFFTYNYLFFGYMAAVFSIFSLLMANHSKRMRLFYYAGTLAGLIACILSGTRGALLGWFAGLIILLLSHGLLTARIKKVIVLLMVLVPISLALIPGYKSRINVAYNSIVHSENEQYKLTSTGLRLKMWSAAWSMFKDNPVLGVGLDGYELEIKAMAENGEVDEMLTKFDHPHNIYLAVLANMGLLGFSALMLVLLVPFAHFYKQLHTHQGNMYAMMGVSLVVMYAVFGLTEAIFEIQKITAFYVFMVVLLYSAIRNSEKVG